MQFEKDKLPTPALETTDTVGDSAAMAMASLLADMNHDIRTSMNGILGMLELLLDTELTASQRQYARIAQHSVDTLLELIERVVDLSLIESTQFKLAHSPFNLLQEMQSACINKEETARGKGLQLMLSYPPAVQLIGDPARLREIISSLIDIALRFTDRGEIVVEMATVREQPGRCNVGLAIHAPYLSAAGECLASVLNQPTEGGIAALRTYGKGALELVLCSQLARLMGGSISVYQPPQQGTTFRFSIELPLAPNPVADTRGMVLAEHPADWDSLFSRFRDLGARIDAFDSAVAALAALRQAETDGNPYRVVMLCRQVQGMDASILGTAIKGDPACKDTLLAILCERPLEDVARFAQSGFSAMIARSAPPHAVLSAMNQLWSAAASGTTPPFISTESGSLQQPQGESLTPFSGRRLLVADDNPVNQQVALRMLEKLGCKADIAVNGEEAVDMHADACYDLILMDCEMPKLDGFQATEKIRAAERTGQHTPIIALTACTAQGEREQCLAAGMDDFLSKPIRPQILRETLARWLPQVAAAVEETPSSGCIDELDVVRDMFGNDFSELAALYRNDSPPRIEKLHDANATGNLAMVAKIAHAFSGSSASIGASGLSALCKELELRAKAGAVNDFEKRMTAIEAEYQRVSKKLQDMLD